MPGRPVTDAVREIMYELAALEADDLAEVERLCRAFDGEDDLERLREIEARVDELAGTARVPRVRAAYEALTDRRI